MSDRDDFLKPTRDALALRVGVRCSNPGCRKLTMGPRSDEVRVVCIGVAAHITAASEGGARFNAALSTEERRSVDNGIWLCQNCGKLIDNDAVRFTTPTLRAWKERAEAAARAEIEGSGASALPQDAADLELRVGGVPVGSARAPRAVAYRRDSSGHCDRHDYELTVMVRNLGSERLGGYHVDLEFPARVLERPEVRAGYFSGRGQVNRAFFRAADDRAPELFPGDEHAIITLGYYVDDDLFHNWRGTAGSHVFKESVRATLYRRGLRPMTVERPFDDFQNF